MSWIRPAAVVAGGALGTAGLLVLTPATDAAPGSASVAGDGYQGYVACSTKKSAKPKHTCKQSQPKAAFFVSSQRDVTYKVCVKFPQKPKRLCASTQQAPRGEKQSVTIATADPGRHKVSWYVGGKKVAGWTFEVTAG
jgi:hypothetical protein